MTDTSMIDPNSGNTGTLPASPPQTILEVAQFAISHPDKITSEQAMRLGTFIVDRREHVQAHYEHLQMAGAGAPMPTMQRSVLMRRMEPSRPQTSSQGTLQGMPDVSMVAGLNSAPLATGEPLEAHPSVAGETDADPSADHT